MDPVLHQCYQYLMSIVDRGHILWISLCPLLDTVDILNWTEYFDGKLSYSCCRYVIAAISPAIVVPTSLSLQGEGYGKSSGMHSDNMKVHQSLFKDLAMFVVCKNA